MQQLRGQEPIPCVDFLELSRASPLERGKASLSESLDTHFPCRICESWHRHTPAPSPYPLMLTHRAVLPHITASDSLALACKEWYKLASPYLKSCSVGPLRLCFVFCRTRGTRSVFDAHFLVALKPTLFDTFVSDLVGADHLCRTYVSFRAALQFASPI